jgi:uncharacterized protein YecE (DUF72 family)
MAGKVNIGTSGWHYKGWFGLFYPEKLPAKDMLAFYAQHFDTVEVNNTFYHLPSATTFDSWRDNSPDNFLFAVRASRFITHLKSRSELACTGGIRTAAKAQRGLLYSRSFGPKDPSEHHDRLCLHTVSWARRSQVCGFIFNSKPQGVGETHR